MRRHGCNSWKRVENQGGRPIQAVASIMAVPPGNAIRAGHSRSRFSAVWISMADGVAFDPRQSLGTRRQLSFSPQPMQESPAMFHDIWTHMFVVELPVVEKV